MTDLSRRRVLLTGGGLALTGLAGCTGTESDGDEPNGTDANETLDDGNATDGGTNETGGANETDAAEEPRDYGDVHKHGQLRMVVDGEWIALGENPENWKANGADKHFYFSEGDGTTWHLRSRGVTLEYALNAIPTIEATADSLTYDGTTYEDGDGASVTYLVNDEQVSFESYALQHGDVLRVVVETDGSGGGAVDGGNSSTGGGNATDGWDDGNSSADDGNSSADDGNSSTDDGF